LKPRLARPLIAAILGGAMVAGGVVAVSPAYARDVVVTADETTEPTTTPTTDAPTTEPTTEAPTTEPTTEAPTTEPTTEAPTTAPTTTAPTTPADTVKPTGKFRLTSTSIWTGQQVILYQNTSEYGDAEHGDETVSRTVYWGDGTKSVFTSAGSTWIKHNYKKAGTFQITENLTDAAHNSTLVTAKVAVANAPTSAAVSKKSVWPMERYTFTVKWVPKGTTSYVIEWGDGFTSTYKWTGKARSFYARFGYQKGTYKVVSGQRYMKIAYVNANGLSSFFNAAPIYVKKDSWKPTVTITKPSSSNRLKSWKYVSGTAKDPKGAGVSVVSVGLEMYANGKDYCLNAKHKWQQVDSSNYASICRAVVVPVVKGKWKFKVPATLKKGYFWVDARSWDYADNHSAWKTVSVKITRS
jgi:hypothetical protein